MAEKNQQAWAPTNGYTRRSDQELGTDQFDHELKRKKRIKLAIYIAIFAVFQMIVIGVFGAVVMKAKTPKFRLSNNVHVQKLDTNQESSPSFDLSFTNQVRIKNPNFGPYKFDGTTVTFTYQGSTVGEISILKGKAGMKSTKKIDVSVSLNSTNLPNKANEWWDFDPWKLSKYEWESGTHVDYEEEEVYLYELYYCFLCPAKNSSISRMQVKMNKEVLI